MPQVSRLVYTPTLRWEVSDFACDDAVIALHKMAQNLGGGCEWYWRSD